MMSYCIACLRPSYSRMLIAELSRKTSVPYEILVWLNTDDAGLSDFIETEKVRGIPITVIGRTPENIGMVAYKDLFSAARFDLVTQLDDDVLFVSRRIAQVAARAFERHPRLGQVVADVWRDEFTGGAAPRLSSYKLYDGEQDLYEADLDGWFSVYRRSTLELLAQAPYEKYFHLGTWAKGRLCASGCLGLLSKRMAVFHSASPDYAYHFGMLDFEIEKYRSIGREDYADAYEVTRRCPPSREAVRRAVENAESHLAQEVPDP